MIFEKTDRPEDVGVSSKVILEFLQEIKALDIDYHGMVIIKDDKIAFEEYAYPYSAELPHMMFSITKSIVSTAAGFAIDEGKMRLDTNIREIFTEFKFSDDPRWDDMTIERLLTMSSGKKFSFTRDLSKGDYSEIFINAGFRRKGGFLYSQDDPHLVADAVERVTGQSLVDYLMPRLFDPLDIKRPFWERNSIGHSVGGTGLYLTTMDLAKISYCYLNKGAYGDKQVIPERWAKRATTAQVISNKEFNHEGYGYFFWCPDTGFYRADGMFGQLGVVFPEQNAIISITSCKYDEFILGKCYKKYFPKAFLWKSSDGNDSAKLKTYTDGLKQKHDLPVSSRSPIEQIIEGKKYSGSKVYHAVRDRLVCPVSLFPTSVNATFACRPHSSLDDIKFDFVADKCVISWTEENDRIEIHSGMNGEPCINDIVRSGYPFKLWSHCHWEGRTLVVTLKPLNTVATQIFRFKFTGSKAGSVHMKIKSNPDLGEFVAASAVVSGDIPNVRVITPMLQALMRAILSYDHASIKFKNKKR